MSRLRILMASVAVALLAFGLASSVLAAPPDGRPAQSEHERIVRYWTPERVAQAIPRELHIDIVVPAKGKPGGVGGGGGDGDSGAVTGATWTGGGVVKATTGKVLFTLGSTNYVCSGSVVADARVEASLVLTAGHCVYDERSGTFATNWMFVPDYEDQKSFDCDLARYGCWTATSLVTTSAWAARDFNHDYAFAVMGPGGKSGQSLLLENQVGTQQIAFNFQHPTQVYAFGYPHARPYNGQTLTYCAGTDVPDTWGGSSAFGLLCDMTGGSSGGPWFVNFDPATGIGQLNSVNSFKYRGGPASKYMFGPYLGDYAQATYQAAQTAGANTLVGAP